MAEEARQQLRMAHEYEAISDYVTQLQKFDELAQGRLPVHRSKPQRSAGLSRPAADYLERVNEANVQQNPYVLAKLEMQRKHVRAEAAACVASATGGPFDGVDPPQVSVAFMARALNAYTRSSITRNNIAEAVAGEK